MAITIANLMAQIGADISQFNIGMNEVNARMRLAELRSAESDNRIRQMRERAAQLTENADIARAARARARAAAPILRNDAVIAQNNVDIRQRNVDAANQAVIAARATNVVANVEAASRRLQTATTAFQNAERKLRGAQTAVATNVERESRLGLVEGRLRGRAATVADRAVSFDAENRQAQEVARRYAARLAQNAQEHGVRAYNAVAATSERAGMVLGAGMAVATKIGSDFNQMLLTTGHNTSLSAAGISTMNDTVKRLGIESGAPMDKLADGFRAIENRGYSAVDSVKLLTPAMEAAVAKGSDLSVTTTLLANVMKEFSIPVDRATDAMGMLVEISRKSGVNMEDMVHVFGQMTAISGNFGVSLADTGAAFVLFTRHGLNASQAATQFRNDINKIINPSAKTRDAIKDIFKNTGTDLSKYFGGAGLRAHGFSGLFGEEGAIAQVAPKYKGGVERSDITNRLFPNMRGQLGAAILSGTGAKEWASVLKNIQNASTSGAGVNKIYQESLNQINQQLERLKNAGIVAASSIANTLAPDLKKVTDVANGLVASFNNLNEPAKHGIATFATFAAGTLVLAGVMGKLIVGVSALNSALILMGTEGLVAVTLAAAPLVVGVGLLTAAFFGLWYVMDQADQAPARAAAALRAATAATAANSVTAVINQRNILNLAQQYEKLEKNTHKTHAQSLQMQDILDRLATLAPQLATGFDTAGHAVGAMGGYVETATRQLVEMEKAARLAKAAVVDLAISEERGRLLAASDALRKSQFEMATGNRFIPASEMGHGVGGPFSPMPMQYRPATAREILIHAPGLTKGKEPFHLGDLTPWTQGKGPMIGSEHYLMPPLRMQPGAVLPRGNNYSTFSTFLPPRRGPSTPVVISPQSVEAAQLATKIKAQQAEEALHNRTLIDLAKQRVDAINGPVIPNTPSIDLGKVGFGGGSDVDKFPNGKDKKAKAEKETEKERETRRLADQYQNLMESMVQQQYLNEHPGKQGDMLWETREHSKIKLPGGDHTIVGQFAGYPQALKDQLVHQAKMNDEMQAGAKWTELQKNSELELFAARKNADKTDHTPEQLIGKRAELGGYKEYGSHASDAMGADLALAKAKETAKLEEQVIKFREEANKPLEKSLSAHDQMIKDIKGEAGLYAYMESIQAGSVEKLAKLAQTNNDNADATKLYNEEVEKMVEIHNKIQEQVDDNKTNLEVLQLKLKTDAYKNLTDKMKEKLLLDAKNADAFQATATYETVHKSVTKGLDEQVQQAHIDVRGATDPKEQRFDEFKQKAIEGYGEAWKKMTAEQKASANEEIQSSFTQIYWLGELEKRLHSTADVMEAVAKGTKEITDKVAVQAGNIRITKSEWDRLSETQKNTVKQYAEMFNMNSQINEMMQGLVNVFGNSLDHIRQHGFKGFFTSVLSDFDDMLYQMAKKWLQSQISTMLNNLVTGLTTGLTGGKGIDFDAGGGPSAGGGILGGIIGVTGQSVGIPDIGDIGSMLGLDGALAGGGPVSQGASYLVGEKGPEIFTPQSRGTVIPNSQIGGVGGTTVHLHLHGVTDERSFQQSSHQVTQTLGRMIAATGQR